MISTLFGKIRSNWRPYLLIIIIGLVLYGQTVFFDFSYLDDNALILDNHQVLSDVSNIGLIFSSDVFFSASRNYYRPILNLSLMFDTMIGGVSPVFFHLVNVLIHLLAASLVFLALKRMGRSQNLSLFLSLVFLVHPALSQAVVWIPGRNDSLLAVFMLGAWLAFLSFFKNPRLISYFSFLVLFWLALLTKETAIMLPILAGLYILIERPSGLRQVEGWLMAAGSAVVVSFWFIMRHLALGGSDFSWPAAIFSVWENSEAIFIYIGKLFLPFNLAVFPILLDSSLIYGILSLLILFGLLILSRPKSWPMVGFGALWFLLFLIPSFIRLNGLPDFLEHRAYLSFFGFLIIISEIDWVRRVNWYSYKTKIIAVSILIVLSFLTFSHVGDFKDRLTFWQAAVRQSPHSPMAQRNLGVMYYFEGDLEKAEQHYKEAIRLNNQEEMVHNNLGVVYLDKERYEEAKVEFMLELDINPAYTKALFNLGETYYKQGKNDEAIYYWRAASVANPVSQEARQRLLIWQNQIQ